MKTINVESLAGRCAPSSDFGSNRWLAIKLTPTLNSRAGCKLENRYADLCRIDLFGLLLTGTVTLVED